MSKLPGGALSCSSHGRTHPSFVFSMHLVSHDSVSMATQGLIHANNNQKHPVHSGLGGGLYVGGWVGGTNGLQVPPL